jgi:hypothetical protein
MGDLSELLRNWVRVEGSAFKSAVTAQSMRFTEFLSEGLFLL